MAQLEVIALDTAVPQLRAPGGSDTYLMPKDLTIQGTATVDSGATINGGAVFNETGADVDFRIESDTNANAFFLDGATGNVGIGGAADNTTKLNLVGTYPTSGTVTRGIMLNGTIPSGSTAFGIGFTSLLNTEAASFTLSNLYHYQAAQGIIGAGSTVTNQYGCFADSTLTGATNNYGFYSNIASGSGRYNFFAAGTAANYFAGKIEANGGAVFNETGADVDFRIESDTVTNAFFVDGATGNVGIRTSSPNYQLEIENANTTFRMTDLGANSTYVSASTVATQAQIGVARQGINSSSAFLTAIGNSSYLSLNGLSGTANLITTESNGDLSIDVNGLERMRIDASGNVGIGGVANASSKVFVTGTLPSSSNLSIAFRQDGTIPSATTSAYIGFFSFPTTEAASFTLGVASGFTAAAQAFGAGSTVTTQIGFEAASSLTGATNNYGFYSNIASGANRWNLYCNGTAENYVANNLKIGGTAARATTAGTNQLVLFNGTAPVGTLANGVSFYSASGEANVMDAAGNATLLSPHDSETNEWIFRSKHTPTGKVLKIDVEKMLRFINEHFDLDMVQEWTE